MLFYVCPFDFYFLAGEFASDHIMGRHDSLFDTNTITVEYDSPVFVSDVRLNGHAIARLTGAVAGSSILVDSPSENVYMFYISNDAYYDDCQRNLYVKDGKYVLVNDRLFYKPAVRDKGLALKALGYQVAECRRLGIAEISVNAAGYGPEYFLQPPNGSTGYYVWPRYGFDGLLPPETIKAFSAIFPHLANIRTIQELFATETGIDWWRRAGHKIALTFDVSAESNSSAILSRRLIEKGV